MDAGEASRAAAAVWNAGGGVSVQRTRLKFLSTQPAVRPDVCPAARVLSAAERALVDEWVEQVAARVATTLQCYARRGGAGPGGGK